MVLRRSGVHAEIEVSDTGPGLPGGVVPGSRKTGAALKPDGTGVGLAITRDFILEHGGTFEIGNAPPAGALVRIRLPLCPPPLSPQSSS